MAVTHTTSLKYLTKIILFGFIGGLSHAAHAQSFYGGSEYLNRPPPPPPPSINEFTQLAPPPPPPESLAGTWQYDGYRRGDAPAPWAAPLWGAFQSPQPSPRDGWNAPAFMPWGLYIQGVAPYPPPPPSRSCIDGTCTGQ